jgi:signal transduction histidine kinase/CheY-like chemotaxis protein
MSAQRRQQKESRLLTVAGHYSLSPDQDCEAVAMHFDETNGVERLSQPRTGVESSHGANERPACASGSQSHPGATQLNAVASTFSRNDRARQDFLASINYEMRSPLGGILGHTELLLNDRHLSAEQRRHVESIRSASSSLLGVVNHVVNFAIADAGDSRVDAESFDLSEALHSAVSTVSHQCESKGLHIELRIDPELPRTVVGDRERVRQVVVNLLENAVRFTMAGSIRLSAECEGRGRDSANMRFSVTDRGAGLSLNDLAGMFESPSSHATGTQLGAAALALRVAKLLVGGMGGTIGVDCIPHFGSSVWFRLSLPIAHPEKQNPRVPVRPAVPRSARVLLVEDDEINQEIARSMLEAAGHQVDVACDGSVALLAVQSNIYHLVLMDVQMPIMDGVSATRLIRSLPGPECDVPIIAMTASVLPEQVRSFKEAGMNDHVAKPFQKEELLSLVERWAFDSINSVIHSLARLAVA